ncbi:hypothetical protein DXT99_18860 [Pontibacter diazotrophicus]|uniref:Glycosyltransferase RgtA/B/C/D-like domain-containing protein n=1 Tax=Pontibacter diazotrophicus TaxID=1400979 RepID=A0A3D8L862_9BACT|nr:hypothetical protein [Pontibacter diazotrophicus]RDV13599.1 hypothetical protein DXT99_18860 [Pontibacter diazotrophicus]
MSKESQLPVRPYWEYVLPALAIISLLVSCIYVSGNKFFWNDELYSYYFTSDPSFTGMLSAFHDKINNTPLLYFLLGWIWDKAFGSSELSLRLFSSLGMCVALVVTWVVVRRHFGLWSTTVGVLGVFCTSEVILLQNAEARMYGLFLALSAFALLLYDQFYRNFKPSNKQLILNSCVHIAIVHTHLFGGFYSGAILLAMLVADWFFNIFRLRVYLSIILSWVTILFYIPSFLNQADAGNPRTWLPEPIFRDLLDMFHFHASTFLHQSLPLLLLVISVFIIFGRELKGTTLQREPAPTTNTQSIIPLMVLTVAFLVLPVFIWVISKTIKPIFWERYMIPSALGWVIVLAYFSSYIFHLSVFKKQVHSKAVKFRHLPSFMIGISAFVLLAFFLCRPLMYANTVKKYDQPGTTDATGGYNDLPVVLQMAGPFLERIHYAPNPERYYYILDWEAAVDENSGLFTPQEYKHMEAIKRNYPHLFQNNVLTTEEFLQRFDRFLVLDHPDYLRECPLEPQGLETAREWDDIQCPQWVEMRLLNNDAYNVTFLNDDNWFSVLLVEKQEDLRPEE